MCVSSKFSWRLEIFCMPVAPNRPARINGSSIFSSGTKCNMVVSAFAADRRVCTAEPGAAENGTAAPHDIPGQPAHPAAAAPSADSAAAGERGRPARSLPSGKNGKPRRRLQLRQPTPLSSARCTFNLDPSVAPDPNGSFQKCTLPKSAGFGPNNSAPGGSAPQRHSQRRRCGGGRGV